MNAIQKQFGPFAHACPPGWGMTHVHTSGADDRIKMVKQSDDQEWLAAVISHAEQKTVRVAAARRIAKLMKVKREVKP